jgi:hypothetical protein
VESVGSDTGPDESKTKAAHYRQRSHAERLPVRTGSPYGPQFPSGLSPRPDSQRNAGAWGVLRKIYDGCAKGVPPSWFTRAKLSPHSRDCSLNYFCVDASQPLSVWRKKGWIHSDDPRGWFQWYCRYYMGRRMPEEDARQMRRWNAMRRHVAQIKRHCEHGDQTCRKRQRQALLHWAYDSRKI